MKNMCFVEFSNIASAQHWMDSTKVFLFITFYCNKKDCLNFFLRHFLFKIKNHFLNFLNKSTGNYQSA